MQNDIELFMWAQVNSEHVSIFPDSHSVPESPTFLNCNSVDIMYLTRHGPLMVCVWTRAFLA
jgi:hypothetical protein